MVSHIGMLVLFNRHYVWNTLGTRGEPDKRKVLTDAELPELGGGEIKGIYVVADGE